MYYICWYYLRKGKRLGDGWWIQQTRSKLQAQKVFQHKRKNTQCCCVLICGGQAWVEHDTLCTSGTVVQCSSNLSKEQIIQSTEACNLTQ